jgi:uncharacterized membrane protein required for colicin V production
MTLIVDLVLVLCLVLTMIAGARAGFFRELFSFLGLGGGVWAGLRFSSVVLLKLPPFFHHSTFAAVVLFVIIFLIVFALLRLVGAAFSALWEGKSPSGLSRVFGFALGTARGLILVLFLAGAIVLLVPAGNGVLGRSRVLPYLAPGVKSGAQILPPDVRARLLSRWDALPFPGHTPVHGTEAKAPASTTDARWIYPARLRSARYV